MIGTYSIADLLKARFSSAVDFGMDTIAQVLQADLAAYNAMVSGLLSDLAEVSSDRRRIYGSSTNGRMQEVDEFGRAPSQRSVVGAEACFPLRVYQFPVGWTRKYLANATPADLAQGMLDAQKAHAYQLRMSIAQAIFNDTNYSVADFNVDNATLNVKRFVNADSAVIPDGPNGETYAGAVHNHYTAAAALAVGDLTTMINTVVEHGHGGKIILAINIAQEAAVRVLAGFTAYIDPRLILNVAANQPVVRLDMTRLDNRAIGVLGAAEVWVKPWVPSHFYFAWDSSDARKPLLVRTRRGGSPALTLAAEFDMYPLQANYYETEYGIGVWTRTNGACHFDNGAAWANPIIS